MEESIKLHGIGLNIIDTAGIRDTKDEVERIGVEKARKYANNADDNNKKRLLLSLVKVVILIIKFSLTYDYLIVSWPVLIKEIVDTLNF